MSSDANHSSPSNPPPAGRPLWSRATGVLFGLVAVLAMAYGLLFIVSTARTDPAGEPERGDVQLISMQGEPVDLLRHLAPGKVTVVDFYADWCAPWQALAPVLDELARTHQDDLALRKINIVHWGTPVVAQYGVADVGLPYLRMYGPDGVMIADGVDRVMDQLEQRY
ncbi:MAG: thioredoxin domain-containing protein [Acidobacteriota bacterium]